jgi:hypothetical protein
MQHCMKGVELIVLYAHFFGTNMYATILNENCILSIKVDSQSICCIVCWIVVTHAPLDIWNAKGKEQGARAILVYLSTCRQWFAGSKFGDYGTFLPT